jgi:hypothetical protein
MEMSGWMRWLGAGEGGRRQPHPGGRYAATAFAEPDGLAESRSIVFDDVPAGPGTGLGEGGATGWLSGADVSSAWGPGSRLVITEGPQAVAMLLVHALVPRSERAWSFRVTESFTITGRGVGVLGELHGTITRSGEPADLQSREQFAVVPEVWVEFARVAQSERFALLLCGVEKDHVPPGSVLRGCAS